MFHSLKTIYCVINVSRETLSSILFLIDQNVSRETFCINIRIYIMNYFISISGFCSNNFFAIFVSSTFVLIQSAGI